MSKEFAFAELRPHLDPVAWPFGDRCIVMYHASADGNWLGCDDYYLDPCTLTWSLSILGAAGNSKTFASQSEALAAIERSKELPRLTPVVRLAYSRDAHIGAH